MKNFAFLRRRILEYIFLNGSSTGKQMEREIVGKTNRLYYLLNSMVEKGELTRKGSGKRNDRYIYGPVIKVENPMPVCKPLEREVTNRVEVVL